MKKVILASIDVDSKVCRQFATEVCNNAFEDYELEVAFRLEDRIILFTVFRDSSKSSVHTSYEVPFYKVVEAQGNWESLSDLVDNTVNKIATKASKSL